MKNSNQIFGEVGEMVAVKYLSKNGYKILSTNYKSYFGEIDIIAKYKSIFIFIEVKSRESDENISPSDAVNKEKQKHIKNTAEEYMKKYVKKEVDYCFDIIEVVSKDLKTFYINHIQAAF